MLPNVFSENLFDDFFRDFDREVFGGRNPLYGKHARNLMKTDVQEGDKDYKVFIDLPGFKKDEIQLKLEDGCLTVSAAKGLDKDEQDKKSRYIRRERYSGACSRSFYVGDVTPEEVAAKFEDGILSLTIPKGDVKAVESSSHIAIE